MDHLNKKLHISVTKLNTFSNEIISNFKSIEHLNDVLHASSSIPLIQDNQLRIIDGEYYVDGGFTNNFMTSDHDENTIMVSGFFKPNSKYGLHPSKVIGSWIRRFIGFVLVPTNDQIDETIELGYNDMKTYIESSIKIE